MNIELASKYITPSLVLDVGANIGQFYLQAREKWPQARYWLIEANPECEEMLSILLRPKDYLDILVLSDQPKEVEFYTLKECATAVGASYYRERTPFFAEDKTVVTKRETSTLDHLVWGTDFSGLRGAGDLLLKIDTQGSEIDILKGGLTTLQNCKAVILELSLIEYNKGAPLANEAAIFMSEHGFREAANLGDIVHPLNHSQIIQRDALFIR